MDRPERNVARLAASDYRSFPGKAPVVNLLRALHLIGVVGLGASVLGGGPEQACDAYCLLVLLSGAAILALDVWSSLAYVLQIKGMGMAVKLGMVLWMVLDAGHRVELFWVVVALSSLLTHASGRLRGYSPWPALRQHTIQADRPRSTEP